MEKEIRISVSLETGQSTEILILESGIKLDGKPISLDNCVFWAGVFKEIRDLIMMEGHKIVKNTVDDIMNIK